MAYQPTCLVCQKVMEVGYMIDADGAILRHNKIPRWYAGEPKEFLNSVVAPTKEGRMIITYRCPQCKALRMYAPDPE